MYKLLSLTLLLLSLIANAHAVIIKDYRGMDPYSDYPSTTRYRTYTSDDPRYDPGYRQYLYNYNPFPDDNRHEQIFEQNKK